MRLGASTKTEVKIDRTKSALSTGGRNLEPHDTTNRLHQLTVTEQEPHSRKTKCSTIAIVSVNKSSAPEAEQPETPSVIAGQESAGNHVVTLLSKGVFQPRAEIN